MTKTTKKIFLAAFALISALMSACGGASGSDPAAPPIVPEGNGLLGLWTAYSARIMEQLGWADVDFEEDGVTSIELTIDGKANVVTNGSKSMGSYRWEVSGSGFSMTEKSTGSVGHGELENGILNFVFGAEGWESEFRCVKGDAEAAKDMVRDRVDIEAFAGIWSMTEYKYRNGEDVDRAYIFTRGLVLDIRGDGTLDFIDVDSLYYEYGEGGPERCEWSFSDGYMRFRTKSVFWDNVGKFKDGVFVLSYGDCFAFFERDPAALERLGL